MGNLRAIVNLPRFDVKAFKHALEEECFMAGQMNLDRFERRGIFDCRVLLSVNDYKLNSGDRFNQIERIIRRYSAGNLEMVKE